MSYIQIEFAGKERGFKFNQLALETYVKLVDWDNYTTYSEAYALFFAGLKGNCYVKRETLDLTFEQVCDAVDNVSQETILQVFECFRDTQIYKEWLSKFQEQVQVLISQENKDGKKKAGKK